MGQGDKEVENQSTPLKKYKQVGKELTPPLATLNMQTHSWINESSDRVVARVGNLLYTTTASTVAWSLVSNTASAGNWKLSGNRIGLLDGNGLWVRTGDAGWQMWGANDVQEFAIA